MFNQHLSDDLPDELREKMERVTKDAANIAFELERFLRQKLERDDGIVEHEQENAFMPVVNLNNGYRPSVVPFEIRGGEDDGKRIIALCVQLADGKTVMPVLQVADFDAIEQAEYVGSREDLEVILPEDSAGVGWQKVVARTVEEYINIHGGE